MVFKMKGPSGFKNVDMSKLRSKQARMRKGISEFKFRHNYFLFISVFLYISFL